MKRVRVMVHALDRTGPPVLARTFVEWCRRHHSEVDIEVLAFRGGPLAAEMTVPVTVVLDDQEHWPGSRSRFESVAASLGGIEPVDANLMVSVAAGQLLPLLPEVGPLVCWAVEVGEDLHWVGDEVGLIERTDRWLAGSQATAGELGPMLAEGCLPVVPEFVAPFVPPNDAVVADARAAIGAAPGELLVVGAGIATHRKGIDLFMEAAIDHRRRWGTPARFVWVGGESDPLCAPVTAAATAMGVDHFVAVPSTPDLSPLLAAADVFLHPARADAFPLVCLHAASSGTPVVAFAGVGGVTEMFGECFLGAPYPDLPALVDVVDSLSDQGARREAGDAQAAAVERFSVEVAAPALFEALSGPSHARGGGRE